MPLVSQSDFLYALGWAVINSLWQMALLWLVYKFFVLVFKPGSALKTKSAFILLITGTVWFIISFILAYRSTADHSLFFTLNGYSLNESISSLLPYASIIYLVLLSIPVFRFVINIRQVMIIRTKKLKKIEIQWRLFVKKMAAYLEIRKPVQVWVSENITSPITIGFLKPVILVPLAAVNQLNTQQMEAVLLHELAHIKRYDYLLNIIAVIIRTIFYFNPFTRNLASIIEDEREKSCDEWVLQYQYDGYTYSSALLAIEQLRINTVQLALGAAGKKDLLLNRIKKIMGIQAAPVYSIKNSLGWISGIACSALLFFILFANAVKNEPSPIAFIQSPLNFLQNSNPDLNLIGFTNNTNRPVAGIIKHKQVHPGINKNESTYNFTAYPEFNNYIIPVSYTEPVTVELDEAKEMQVKEAMDASKKIIKDLKWKEVNTEVADAMTEIEKQELKKFFNEKMSEIDLKEFENKLRTSYNQLNWDDINKRVNNALTEIKIDSLTIVYNIALSNLSKAKDQLITEGMKGIPDSEITLTGLDAAKKTLDHSLNKLKAIKEKKIIRL